MKCTDCKYCLCIDYGYSNWTVEGTEVHCLLRMNPDFPEDRFYGEEKSLDFANSCQRFICGDCIDIDVERGALDNYDDALSTAYTNDPDIKILLDAWEFGHK